MLSFANSFLMLIAYRDYSMSRGVSDLWLLIEFSFPAICLILSSSIFSWFTSVVFICLKRSIKYSSSKSNYVEMDYGFYCCCSRIYLSNMSILRLTEELIDLFLTSLFSLGSSACESLESWSAFYPNENNLCTWSVSTAYLYDSLLSCSFY